MLTFDLEYIGQLEGELAAKSNEADDLRSKNEDLIAENTRLTDLTRMLLSSPSFSTFLNDISGNGSLASIPEHSQVQAPPQQQSRTAPRKDVNPHQATTRHQSHQQNNVQIGMAMIPESAYEYNVTESTDNGWAENNNQMDFGPYDAQVFAVTSVSEGPAIDLFDLAMLHGKSTDVASSYPRDDVKDMAPSVEYMPATAFMDSPAPVDTDENFEINKSDPTCASSPVRSLTTPRHCTAEPEDRNFGEIEHEKAFERMDLAVAEDAIAAGQVGTSTLARFERLCSRIEVPLARVAAVTSHL